VLPTPMSLLASDSALSPPSGSGTAALALLANPPPQQKRAREPEAIGANARTTVVGSAAAGGRAAVGAGAAVGSGGGGGGKVVNGHRSGRGASAAAAALQDSSVVDVSLEADGASTASHHSRPFVEAGPLVTASTPTSADLASSMSQGADARQEVRPRLSPRRDPYADKPKTWATDLRGELHRRSQETVSMLARKRLARERRLGGGQDVDVPDAPPSPPSPQSRRVSLLRARSESPLRYDSAFTRFDDGGVAVGGGDGGRESHGASGHSLSLTQHAPRKQSPPRYATPTFSKSMLLSAEAQKREVSRERRSKPKHVWRLSQTASRAAEATALTLGSDKPSRGTVDVYGSGMLRRGDARGDSRQRPSVLSAEARYVQFLQDNAPPPPPPPPRQSTSRSRSRPRDRSRGRADSRDTLEREIADAEALVVRSSSVPKSVSRGKYSALHATRTVPGRPPANVIEAARVAAAAAAASAPAPPPPPPPLVDVPRAVVPVAAKAGVSSAAAHSVVARLSVVGVPAAVNGGQQASRDSAPPRQVTFQQLVPLPQQQQLYQQQQQQQQQLLQQQKQQQSSERVAAAIGVAPPARAVPPTPDRVPDAAALPPSVPPPPSAPRRAPPPVPAGPPPSLPPPPPPPPPPAADALVRKQSADGDAVDGDARPRLPSNDGDSSSVLPVASPRSRSSPSSRSRSSSPAPQHQQHHGAASKSAASSPLHTASGSVAAVPPLPAPAAAASVEHTHTHGSAAMPFHSPLPVSEPQRVATSTLDVTPIRVNASSSLGAVRDPHGVRSKAFGAAFNGVPVAVPGPSSTAGLARPPPPPARSTDSGTDAAPAEAVGTAAAHSSDARVPSRKSSLEGLVAEVTMRPAAAVAAAADEEEGKHASLPPAFGGSVWDAAAMSPRKTQADIGELWKSVAGSNAIPIVKRVPLRR
jgi:hypothetical protein